MTEALRDAVPPTMDKAVKEALEPFAKAVGLYDERWPDERRLLPSNPDGSTVTLGDLRRARAALAHLNDSPEPVARPASPAAEGVRETLHWSSGRFAVHDPEPDNHHSAIYLVCPDGLMLNISGTDWLGVDLARTVWMADALNAAISAPGPSVTEEQVAGEEIARLNRLVDAVKLANGNAADALAKVQGYRVAAEARAEKAEAALLARDGEVARLREALGYNAALNTASEDNGQLLDNVIEAVCKTRPDWPWNRTILRKNILAALNPKEA